MALPEGLLDSVKNYLDITWTDTDGDTKLEGIIARGMQRLNRSAGETLDFEAEGEPRALLFVYCMYDRAHALDEFEDNYLSELLSLQQQAEVAAYVEKQAGV